MRIFTLLAILSTFATAAYSQTDLTSKVVNNSFESNNLNGWSSSGFQVQNNNAPIEQGLWQKHGNCYAESWVEAGKTLGDISLQQTVSGLADGFYVVRARAHAIQQSDTKRETTGTYLFAGNSDSLVNKGGEYSVSAVVTNGKLTFGMKTSSTTANWVGVDYFRLFLTDGTVEEYQAYLRHLYHDVAVYAGNRTRPYSWYSAEGTKALSSVDTLSTDKSLLLSYVKVLQETNDSATKIFAAYNQLQEENRKLQGYYIVGFGANDDVMSLRSDVSRTLRSRNNAYNDVLRELDQIAQIEKLVNAYYDVKREISLARKQIEATDYPGKEDFVGVCNDVNTKLAETKDIDTMNELIRSIKQAQTTYLANRPSEWITIQNGNAWYDTNGNMVQAHAPGFVRVGDIWYMVGENRGNADVLCCDINLYSSTDLQNWKFEKRIVNNDGYRQYDHFMERPKLLYNDRTKKFVVWCHYEVPGYSSQEAAVFECDSVNGDYRQVWHGHPLGHLSADDNVFTDNDGTAYFFSTTNTNANIQVYRLSDDYLTPLATTIPGNGAWGPWREAPAVVHIGSTYYMLTSGCNGWDPNQCAVATSRSMMDGWSGLTYIGNAIAYDTQCANILTIKGTKATTYLYVGDRWQDPYLPESKTIIFPISFTNNSCNFQYHERFDINFVTGEWRETPNDDRFATAEDKKNWRVIDKSSEELSAEYRPATNVIDGNKNTFWHSHYSGTAQAAPFYVTVDMGQQNRIKGFVCTPRMDGQIQGLIRDYKFEVSNDGENWTVMSEGGWLPYCTEVDFRNVDARYFRMTERTGESCTIAEIDIVKAGTTTGIDAPITDEQTTTATTDDAWYTLSGMKLSGKPATKGIYIHNGKKYILK